MGLINAFQFIQIIESYRLLWIAGRPAGGKTSLAYILARHFLEKGYRLITNNRSVWADDLSDINLMEDGLLHCVILLDEGGLEFKAGRQIESIAAYVAKMDCVFMIPSFWPPCRAAQVITCQPLFNFKGIGVPLIFYKWQVRLKGFEDNGYFFWFNPKEIYGVYSRQDPGGRATDIVQFLWKKQEQFRAYHGRSEENKLPDMEVTSEDIFSDAVEGLGADVEKLATVHIRKTGRRRF